MTGGLRTCPACEHDHAVGTTCEECPECRRQDLVPVATDIFGNLLPGGADWQAALGRHNHSLRLYAACDGDCDLPDCRAPCLDEAGLTHYRDGAEATARLLTLGDRAHVQGAAAPTNQEPRR